MISIFETSVLSRDQLTAALSSSRMQTAFWQCEVDTNSLNGASQWHKSIHQFSITTYPAVRLGSLHPRCVRVKASSSSQGRSAKHVQLWTVGGSQRTWARSLADTERTFKPHTSRPRDSNFSPGSLFFCSVRAMCKMFTGKYVCQINSDPTKVHRCVLRVCMFVVVKRGHCD